MTRVLTVAALALAVLLVAGCGGSRRCSGTEVILRATPANGRHVTPAGMQTAQSILESRLNKLGGVSSPTVAVKGGDEIVIRLAGAHDPATLAKTIDVTGRLQMFDLEPSLARPTVTANEHAAPLPSLYGLLEAVQKEAGKGSPEAYYLFETSAPHPVVQGPTPTLHDLFLPYKGGRQPPHTQVLKVPANREPVRCSGIADCPGAGGKGTSQTGEYWYLFKQPAALTGKDLLESGIAVTVDPNTGAPIVTLQFTKHGEKAFQAITKAEYDRGRADAAEAGRLSAVDQSTINRFAGHSAIVLDGELKEAPYIDYTDPSLSQGIVGNAQITEPSTAAANRTALVLQSGSLPYTFEQVERPSCSK